MQEDGASNDVSSDLHGRALSCPEMGLSSTGPIKPSTARFGSSATDLNGHLNAGFTQ